MAGVFALKVRWREGVFRWRREGGSERMVGASRSRGEECLCRAVWVR